MNQKFKKFIYSLISFVLFLSAGSAMAGPRDQLTGVGNRVGLKGGFPELVGTIITGILGVSGVIFLIMVFYAGFQWLIAQGDEGKIKKSKDLMIWATFGMVVMFLAYAITLFLINNILLGKPITAESTTNITQ